MVVGTQDNAQKGLDLEKEGIFEGLISRLGPFAERDHGILGALHEIIEEEFRIVEEGMPGESVEFFDELLDGIWPALRVVALERLDADLFFVFD